MTHTARPETSSRTSFAKRGNSGARPAKTRSGERKEHLLEPSTGRQPSFIAQGRQLSLGAHAASGKQYETIADPLRVRKLMDCQQQRPAAPGHKPQQCNHLARLVQIETVEGFIHHEQWVLR